MLIILRSVDSRSKCQLRQVRVTERRSGAWDDRATADRTVNPVDVILVPVFAILMLVAPIACCVWQFRQVRRGQSSRAKGVLHYIGWSGTPLLIYIGLFFALVGAEEVLDASLVGEGYARSLGVLGGGGLLLVILGAVVFSILVTFVK